jgi:hypothetical protein
MAAAPLQWVAPTATEASADLTQMRTVTQVVEEIRRRRLSICVADGKIMVVGMLLRTEKAFLEKHRDAVIEYLSHPAPESTLMPESVESESVAESTASESTTTDSPEYQQGYRDGVRHTMEELKSRTDVTPVSNSKSAPALTTPDEAIAKFVKWQHERSSYHFWEPECLSELRKALSLSPGATIRPMFAYTCIIVHADGSETEFERIPPRAKR